MLCEDPCSQSTFAFSPEAFAADRNQSEPRDHSSEAGSDHQVAMPAQNSDLLIDTVLKGKVYRGYRRTKLVLCVDIVIIIVVSCVTLAYNTYLDDGAEAWTMGRFQKGFLAGVILQLGIALFFGLPSW